ncbi:hypothetical protein OYC64_011391 [Pagothenia borchgrevinki]|uniref:Uncharacterized protein n=1 Tax=Pagothenia borchgrevinki TaxID=8213 RepID=A0ABD2FF40_PAGBO
MMLLWLFSAFSLVFLTPVCDAVCSAQEFSCSQDLCVSEGSVCDFTDDCGDYSDEENSHFLSLSPGTRTSADLISPFFLPTETCQLRDPQITSV